MAEILYGKKAAERVLGKQAIKNAIASTKYPGDTRKKPRSDWWPYVFEKENQLYVTSESPKSLETRGMWSHLYGVQKALEYAERLSKGERPLTPLNPVRRPQGWSTGETLLALDIEGIETLDRISLATGTQNCSWQWSASVRSVVQAAINAADTVLGWSLNYDVNMLSKYGVEIPPEKQLDLMYAHQTLNPWRNNGLGKAIPLYAMLAPWKHLSMENAEWYSMMDSAVLIPAFKDIQHHLRARGQWDHFIEVDLPFLAVKHIMESLPADLARGEGCWHRSYKPSFEGTFNEETRAMLHFEAHPVLVGFLDGHTYHISNPTEIAIRVLTGTKLPPQTEMLKRHLMGYGPGQAQKGKSDRADLPLDITYPYYRKACEEFDECHPAIVQWQTTAIHQHAKEHFVTNPFGRRCYATKMPLRWLVESTLCDLVKHITINGPEPLHFTHTSLTYREPIDFDSLLESAIKEATCEIL